MTNTFPVPRIRWRLMLMGLVLIPSMAIGARWADPSYGRTDGIFSTLDRMIPWYTTWGYAIGWWLLLLIPSEIVFHITTILRLLNSDDITHRMIHHLRHSLRLTRRVGFAGLIAVAAMAIYSLGQMCQSLLDLGGEPELAMIVGGLIDPLTSLAMALLGLAGLLLAAWCAEYCVGPILTLNARNTECCTI